MRIFSGIIAAALIAWACAWASLGHAQQATMVPPPAPSASAQAALITAAGARPARVTTPIQAIARHTDTAALADADVDVMLASLLAEKEETAS